MTVSNPSGAGGTFRWRRVGVLLILAVCAIIYIRNEDAVTSMMFDVEHEQEQEHRGVIDTKDVIKNKTSGADVQHDNQEQEIKNTKDVLGDIENSKADADVGQEQEIHFKDDLGDIENSIVVADVEHEQEINTKEVLQDLKKRTAGARIEIDKLIEEDYGQFKDEIFNKETMMKALKSPTNLSFDRLQRRILIKILEAQLRGDQDITFNWVVAGHSSAAGHGNLFKQAYGYILEQTARPVFEALGITFYARNYGMSAARSGPENALCMTAVYGLELDILSWDFAMTDGRKASDLYNIWSQRVGAHPSSPIMVSYGSVHAKDIHGGLEKAGMSVFEAAFVDEKNGDLLAARFPNSDDPKVNVTELPRGVKYYRCGGHTESGEPCGDNLFKWADDEGLCEKVKSKTKWHNGWKDHLLKGRVSALFLIENVLEALSKLDETPSVASDGVESDNVVPSISEGYLNYLYSLEASDKKSFMSSKPPRVPLFEDDLEDLHNAFLRSNTVCRYSSLPSYTRYEGIMTENPQEIKYVGGGRTTYQDEGVQYFKQPEPKLDSPTEPLLVYNLTSDREICEHEKFDFKDYFGIRNEDHWVKTIIPNDSETEAFVSNDDLEKQKGVVTVCESFFYWNNYPQNFVSIHDVLNTNETTIRVNDVPVTSYTRIGRNADSWCYVLANEEGYTFPASEKHGPGKYEIQFKVMKEGGSLYLSSFIVF
eukprot:CAMPEP_0203665688 /NCGR_PEP_ID=MMETSP0090-20130426/2862_1 /ASSEMBLY_ACC=CAM_ASM_001088 /TAXON_ID=426623 /ORGANISM="Chaetoceros affinis, Strain CCMP159" /LENGTH=708 /DNA_ID=CAMNT_0050529329 /DNA_START=46 /DNA_END=2172 /DNA_ORIENTATION=+